ncbi:MAG TPA: hypothetical protein VMH78_08345, partial [Thermoplasmata archaeon]|nr:hypothetical protein [Thermoplasmata archaeon]
MTPPEGTVVLDSARPDRPILVAGPRAFAVLGGAGEMALTLDTRGGPVEWGGVYGEGIRLTSRVEVRWREEERAADLASTMVRLEARLSDVASWHRDVGIEARQTIAPILELEPAPVIGRRIEFAARDGAAHAIHLELSVRPFLAPILLEGIKPYTYRVATRGECLTVDAHGWGLALAADPLPHHLRLDGRAWIGGRFTGEVDEIVLDYDLVVPAAGTLSVGWAIGGGYERWLGEVDGRWAEAIRGGGAAEAARARDDAWRVGTPAVELPRYPGIEAGYREARDGLRRLVHRGEPGLSGLVAGYPWYAAFWTRDLGWMLPALLWLGDHELAAEAIRTVFRFQAPGPIPVLGARRGELPMQIGDGPIFLYGTSDSTLYYPPALVALVDHSGDASVATALAAPLERLAAWIADRTDPATGLLRNGGEVAEIRSATGGVGRVHIGFDAVDTTIWDSTDR